ncbi:MAG TPA: YbaN family protein [Usitatibacter sp.]|nr:YbaN family protein [Usitatibacter sp.]
MAFSPRRAAYVAVGILAVALGVIGIFVPLLPTTPFLLLASACFLRGSDRLHRWLLSHGRLGGYIRAFEEGRGIPRRAKIVAIGMLWISIAYALAIVPGAWSAAALVALALGVTIYLLRLPTLA